MDNVKLLSQYSDKTLIGIEKCCAQQAASVREELARRGVKMPSREPLPANVIDFRRAAKWVMPRSITTGAS